MKYVYIELDGTNSRAKLLDCLETHHEENAAKGDAVILIVHDDGDIAQMRFGGCFIFGNIK